MNLQIMGGKMLLKTLWVKNSLTRQQNFRYFQNKSLCRQQNFNLLPNSVKFKVFADNKLNIAKIMISIFDRVENILG